MSDIVEELKGFENHCIETDQPQVAELVFYAQKEIAALRARVAELEEQMQADINLLRVKGEELERAKQGLREANHLILYARTMSRNEYRKAGINWRTTYADLLGSNDGGEDE